MRPIRGFFLALVVAVSGCDSGDGSPQRSIPTFPNDANGDVLRRMAESGMDLTRSYDIDFVHLFEDKKGAEAMAQEASAQAVRTEISWNETVSQWDCLVVVHLKPTYQGITDMEKRLDEMARRHGGKADGWGVLQE